MTADDQDRRRKTIYQEPFDERDALVDRQLDVKNDEIGPLPHHGQVSSSESRRGDNRIALVAEGEGNQFKERGIIVNDEDSA